MGSSNPDVFKRVGDQVRAIFGDLPIIEAPADFVVYVTADEQERSKRGDPTNCMFSNACKRAFGSKGVLFFPTVAYVDMLDPKDASRRIVMRFLLPKETRARLEAFDRGDLGAHEATFILKAPTKTRTLAYMSKVKRRSDQRRKKIGVTNKVMQAASLKGHETRKTSALMGVRSGGGKIHTRVVDA